MLLGVGLCGAGRAHAAAGGAACAGPGRAVAGGVRWGGRGVCTTDGDRQKRMRPGEDISEGSDSIVLKMQRAESAATAEAERGTAAAGAPRAGCMRCMR